MTKSELRTCLRTRRRDFVAAAGAELETLNLAICSAILDRIGPCRIISAYLSDGQEVDPLPILAQDAARGLVTALPHVASRNLPMRFLRWALGDELVPGPYGLRQPHADAPEVAPDLILTPLLGFDRQAARIGQGAGFYDRAFMLHPAARRIGLAWSVQEVDELPLDPWDMPLDAVATEKEWIEP